MTVTTPMAGPGRSRPALLTSVIRIFDLSLGQMLWSRRSVFLGLVVGGPIVLAVALRLAEASGLMFAPNRPRPAGAMIYGMMIWLLYVRFLVPVLGVFYGTSLIADEVDDKTLTYLFTRPIQRSAVLLGKYLAYLVCTVLLLLPSVVIVFFLVVPLGRGAAPEGAQIAAPPGLRIYFPRIEPVFAGRQLADHGDVTLNKIFLPLKGGG